MRIVESDCFQVTTSRIVKACPSFDHRVCGGHNGLAGQILAYCSQGNIMRQPVRSLTLGLFLLGTALVIGCNKTEQAAPSSSTPAPDSSEPVVQQTAETPRQPEQAAKEETIEEAPEDRKELLAGLMKQYRNGMMRLQKKETEEADDAFIEAGTTAAKLKERFPELTKMERAVCSLVFYNQACAYSKQNETDKALTALQNALDAGFDDFAQLDDDERLAALRGQPEFAQQRAGWETRAYERAVVEMRSQLAEFQTYPFDFTLPDLDAKEVKLADFKGKVVIVDIWGTWCPPCRQEIPSFVKLQSNFQEQGLQIVGLNYERPKEADEKVALIRQFAEETSINYPCLLGNEDTKDQVPDFLGFPTTLFIDRSGKIRLQLVGKHSYGKLRAAVEMLLAESET